MKSAADWAVEFKSRLRGGGCGGQTVDNMRPMEISELVNAVRAEALNHAALLCDDYDSTDELRPLLEDLSELARGGR